MQGRGGQDGAEGVLHQQGMSLTTHLSSQQLGHLMMFILEIERRVTF